ncbi:MAG TPA: NAD(P)-binding protein, partial [Tepidisphaeraceae bacterium]|nr:NAD(P)-binding protein [Tepidisphaeraceae bacterium]
FGIPGRAAADALERQGVEICVIELNAQTVQRCVKIGTSIILGDCTDAQVLRKAGIERARMIAILIPNEPAALNTTALARQLNPTIRIITRCHYISAGIEAKARGANDVIIEEQLVAEQVINVLEMKNPDRQTI